MNHAQKAAINEIITTGRLFSYKVGQWLVAILCTASTTHMYVYFKI